MRVVPLNARKCLSDWHSVFMMIALEELGIFQILFPKVEDKQNLTHSQSKSPINHVGGLWGFYSLLLTRLLNPSVKIGCIKTKKAVKLPKELNGCLLWHHSLHAQASLF